MNVIGNQTIRSGHSLMELIAAMIASSMLLAGLGSVMLIARQTAYTPTAAAHRTRAADVINRLSDEIRYATLILQATPRVLEFVVADRNADGAAEKIRYEWSGVAGAALYKKVNAEPAVAILDSVHEFSLAVQQQPQTASLKTTVDSAETTLLSNTGVQSGTDRDITATTPFAQQINPAGFSAVPANALHWNATRVEFYGSKSGNVNETLLFQLCSAGDPHGGPTSQAIGQVAVAETNFTGTYNWNTIVFTNPVRELELHRRYALVWTQIGGGAAARLRVNDTYPTGVLESSDSGATWQLSTTRQMYGRLFGTYTTPGPTYEVTRNYASHVRLVLRASEKSHARIDASVPLANSPEQLAAYWRADFDRDPTATNANGDGANDWILGTGNVFDPAALVNGVWRAEGNLETRPFQDFTGITTVEVRTRNTTIGGNGAVMRINADRQGGQYAPLLVYVQRQADGTQTLSLYAKSSDAVTTRLFSQPRLSSDFVRYRLTIVPEHNIVNLQINEEDRGTFTYTTYAPATVNDRYFTVYADTSQAEFDFCEVRVAAP